MLLLETSVFWDQNADLHPFTESRHSSMNPSDNVANQGIPDCSPQKVKNKSIGNPTTTYPYSEKRADISMKNVLFKECQDKKKLRAKKKKEKRKKNKIFDPQGQRKNSENNSMKKYMEDMVLKNENIRKVLKK